MNKNITKAVAFLSAVCMAIPFTSCSSAKYSKYSYEIKSVFDTVASIIGYAKSKTAFDKAVKKGETRLVELNRQFDIYQTYAGINNLKTVNDQAGIAPVKVSQDIIDLLLMAKKYYSETDKKVNVAMGAVLKLWHDKREEGLDNPAAAALPDETALKEAAKHCDLDKLVIDEKAKTVFLSDPLMSVDAGMISAGFAGKLAAAELKKAGLKSCLISIGGSHVITIGSPKDGVRKKWSIGIQDPDANLLTESDQVLDTVFLTNTAFATSSDYQNYYFVGETKYNHIIDPVTLYPARYFRAVTVSFPDAGVADLYSEVLFMLPYEDGLALAKTVKGLEAAWVFPGGRIEATDGMKAAMKLLGGASDK